DQEPIAATTLGALGDALPEARLTLVPAFQRLQLSHRVTPVWRALEDGAPPGVLTPAPESVVVFRRDYVVYHVALDAAES
uniref:hypothetical protein n=1 Tax=Salmonella sp. SAL4357 TaxID=3159878 RepID=UPI00397D25F1